MRCQTRWGYAGNIPYISDKRVPKLGSPLPSHPPTHSYTEAAKTRDETPHPAPSATQPEPLPRRRRPQQHLDVPHPPYRMRIRRRSGRPAGSATPSSTSKELPRRSPRLSRHLHSHTAVFTCTTGRASSSPSPWTKPMPTWRHQRGCTLIAAFSSSFDLTVLPALGHEPTRRSSIHGGVAGHFLHGVAPSAATSTSVGAAAALALARAAALLLLSVPCLVCSCSRCCSRS